VVLMVTMLCMGLVYRVTSVGMPKIFAVRVTEFGQTGALGIGSMVTLVFLVQGFAQYAGGVLADRYPPKLIYRLSFLLQMPLLLLAASLFNVPMLLASAMLVLANVAGMPAENVLVAEYAPPKWRATTYGVKFVMSLGVSSLGVGLLAAIHEATGEFVWLFAILAGLTLLGFGATLFLPREEQEPASLQAAMPGVSPPA
jgi:MFS family permease